MFCFLAGWQELLWNRKAGTWINIYFCLNVRIDFQDLKECISGIGGGFRVLLKMQLKFRTLILMQKWKFYEEGVMRKKDILFIGNEQLKTNTTLKIRDTGFKFKTI